MHVQVTVATGAERGVEVGRLRDVLVGVAHHAEEREEHRHLHQEGQTTRERVDLVLLVELHHLFVELGAVVLVLRLELLDLRLRPLHGHHRLGLLGRQREHHQHHEDGEQDDGDPEVRDDPVEEREDRPEEVVDGIERGAGGEDHRVSLLPPRRRARSGTNVRSVGGTGSSPPSCQGWQRPTRRIASQRATAGAVHGERLERVLRARRVEAAARRQVHADQPPGPDREHQEPGERADGRVSWARRRSSPRPPRRPRAGAWSRASRSVGKGSVMTDRSAANEIGAPWEQESPASSATAARSRRRARLRSTALPKRRPMA